MYSRAGLLLLAGMAVTIGGVILCSQAAAAKDAQPDDNGDKAGGSGLGTGLVIAVLAGVFSCFPNVGMNHAESLKAAAVRLGASPDMAGNAAWALLFIAGFVLNLCYCLGLMVRRGNLGALANDFGRNLGWVALMAAMWIGSFYLYGMGAARWARGAALWAGRCSSRLPFWLATSGASGAVNGATRTGRPVRV